MGRTGNEGRKTGRYSVSILRAEEKGKETTMTYDYEKQREIERARNAEVRAKLVKVAEILKQTVIEPKEENQYDCRVETDVLYLTFSAGYGKHRVSVSGKYPRSADGSYVGDIWYTVEERDARKAQGIADDSYGRVSQPSITISPDKTAEQIAKDIQRRLLPDVLDYKRRVQERIDSTNDYESTTTKALETLKGSQLTDYEKKEHRFYGYSKKNSEGFRYEVKASRKEVDVELHNITVEQAEQVLALVLKKTKRGE